jgi:acetyl/propionyl-CoA carboxylase alpha subunit
LIREITPAAGPGIRDDSGVTAGFKVPVFYDSLIAKLVAWAATRDEAIARMSRALVEYKVLGIRTTIPFFLWLMKQPAYRAGQFDTTYLDRLLAERRGTTFSQLSSRDEEIVTLAAALDAFMKASVNSAVPMRAGGSQWLQTARREALRG